MKTKHIVGISFASLILITMMFIPGNEHLSQAGIRTICMLISFLVMLITGPFRMMHTGLIYMGLMPVLGVAPTFNAALSGFGNPIIIFVIASFGLAAAFTSIPLAKRILVALLRRFGKNVRSIMLAIMVSGGIISGLIASVPTCVVFLAIALSFLELFDDPAEKRRSGRAFLIAVPVSVMIGSIMTPISGAINLIALDKYQEFTGSTIPFIQWMALGIPVAVVAVPLAWWFIIKIHKPTEITRDMVEKFIVELNVPEKITRPEINVLIITGVMMTLWVSSSWIDGINVMVVALLGVSVMCLPQLKTLDFDTFLNNIGWDPIFLSAAVLSLGDLMVSNGVSALITSLLPTLHVSTPILIAFSASLFFAMLLVIPHGPTLVIIMAAPLMTLAINAGSSPAILILVAAYCANCSFLIPLDTVTLLSYYKGYYSIKDIFISSLPLQAFLVIVLALWLGLMSRVIGFL